MMCGTCVMMRGEHVQWCVGDSVMMYRDMCDGACGCVGDICDDVWGHV